MKYLITTIIAILFGIQIFAQNINADTILANKYFETAEEYYKNKDYDTATIYFEKSSIIYLKLCQKPNLWQTYGYKYLLSEKEHAKCYQKQRKLNKAIAVIKPAIEKTLLHNTENNIIVADAYNVLGFQYVYQSKFDSTLFYWKKTLKIRKELLNENHADIAGSYLSIGVVYHNKSEYDLALGYYLQSLQIRKKLFGEKHISVAANYNNIGVAYWNKNEYNLALEYYFKSLKIRKELLGEKHPLVANNYNNIGLVYWNKTEYDLALEYYFKSLQIRKELLGEKHIKIANSYNNIGLAYADKKEHDLSLEYYFKALQIYKELLGEKHPNTATNYNNIGLVYADKKEYDSALDYYFKSLKIRKELLGEKHNDVAMSYNNIGNVYSEKNEYDLALEYHFKTLQIRKELLGKKHADVALSYNNIAIVYNRKKEYDLALQYYQKGIASSLRNFNDTINVHYVPQIKDYLNFQYLLQTLQAKAEIFAEPDNVIPLNTKMLSGLSNNDRLKIALRHYQACDTLITKYRQEITTKSDKLALGEKASEIYKDAINVCVDIETSVKPSNIINYNELAFYFSEKNKSSVLLEALAGSEALNFSGIPDTLLNLEHKLSLDITNYDNLKNNEGNDSLANVWNNRLFKSQRSYDSLIVVFETNYPKYYNLKYNNSSATIKQVSDLLDKKTALLSYFIGDSTITIFAIKKKTFPGGQNFIVKQVPKLKKIDLKIAWLRNDISDISILAMEVKDSTHEYVDDYIEVADELYKTLFPKEITNFLNKRIKNIIIIPDGMLATLPFEALHTQKYKVSWTDWKNQNYFSDMPYLVKNYNISYNYSATLFQQSSPKQNTKKVEITPLNDWIAFAPVFDNANTAGTTTRTRKLLTFENKNDSLKTRSYLRNGTYVSPLPGSEKEIETIFDLYEQNKKKAAIKTHKQANEKFVKSKELQNYKIIHFATHGFVNEAKPELSGILFAQDTVSILSEIDKLLGNKPQNEGILFQSEIYNLKFNSELIVLSACETGLGKITKGEGVIGLTRALLYAGTKNIIVSLWQVSDNSTKELMINFYKNLLSDKKQVKFAKHLSDAKRKMIEEKKYAHPYFWSPFILIGE